MSQQLTMLMSMVIGKTCYVINYCKVDEFVVSISYNYVIDIAYT